MQRGGLSHACVGAPQTVPPGLSVQSAEQQLVGAPFRGPSSHCSKLSASTTPFPQVEAMVELVLLLEVDVDEDVGGRVLVVVDVLLVGR